MIDVLDGITLALVGVAGMLCVVRVLRHGSIPDKMLGADTLTIVLASAVVLRAASTGKPYFLDVAMVVTALGFVGTITVARFLEHRNTNVEA